MRDRRDSLSLPNQAEWWIFWMWWGRYEGKRKVSSPFAGMWIETTEEYYGTEADSL
jgi:hypothetical protein